MNIATPSGEWVKPEIAETWPEGITVLVHRPNRKPIHHGYLEVDCYWRPDWARLLVSSSRDPLLFMKVETAQS